MALAKVLKLNSTLKTLNICGNGIGPKLPMALSKHPTLNCLCFEVVTAPPLVGHDPWTTSHTQMNIKKSKLKVRADQRALPLGLCLSDSFVVCIRKWSSSGTRASSTASQAFRASRHRGSHQHVLLSSPVSHLLREGCRVCQEETPSLIQGGSTWRRTKSRCAKMRSMLSFERSYASLPTNVEVSCEVDQGLEVSCEVDQGLKVSCEVDLGLPTKIS